MALHPRQQHKQCCDLLRQAHDALLNNNSNHPSFSAYQEIQLWMGCNNSFETTRQYLSDQYHHHLQLAEISLREHNLLHSQTDRETGATPKPIAIWLDRIRSAHNIGSIVRTTEAFRLGTLYFSPNMAYIDHKQVQDAAMGTQNWITSHRNIPLEQLPKPIVALETSPNAISIHEYLFPESFTLAIGNEEYGLSKETLSLADVIVNIPLTGRKNSLNVANAFAITAAEIHRQALSTGKKP